MKVYVLREYDFKALLRAIDRDPKYGEHGGSSQVLSKEEQDAFEKAHRFYNYQVRHWIDEVQKE